MLPGRGCIHQGFFDIRKFILVSKTLGDIEELLPPDLFLRTHHSIVVNLSFVTHFVRGDGGYIKMQTGEELPVSKSRKEMVLDKLGLQKKI